jgi:hypothetical protein
VYLNSKHLEEMIMAGSFDDAAKYLQAFTRMEDGPASMEAYWAIFKQKYLEALDRLAWFTIQRVFFAVHCNKLIVRAIRNLTGCRKDYEEAVKVLKKDLAVFQNINRETFLELTSLLTLEDFRCVQHLAHNDVEWNGHKVNDSN